MSEAKIVLSAEDKTGAAFASVAHSIETLEHGAETLKGVLEGLGVALSIGEFTEWIHGVIEGADALGKLSERTGISTEHLSQLQYAGKLANVSSDLLTQSIKHLNISIAEGLGGDQAKIAIFKQLGITTQDLGKGTESVMLQIADAYAHAKDGAGKVAVGNALMGKTADEMIPFLNAGKQSIQALMKEADSLGLTISGDFAKEADEFESSLTRMRTGSQKLGIILAGDLVNGLGKAMQAFIEARKEGGTFAATLEFINTLLYGDDRHQANVMIVDVTDQILGTMNALDKARERERSARDVDRAAATEDVARLQKRLVGLQKELDMHRNYAKVLDDEKGKADAARKAAEEARTDGKTLGVPGGGGQAAAYDELNKAVEKRNQLAHAELDWGDKLPEYLKHQKESLADVTDAYRRGNITLAQRLALEAKIDDTSETEKASALRKSAEKDAIETAQLRMDIRKQEYAAAVALGVEEEAAAHQAITSQQARIEGMTDELAALRLSGSANISLAAAVEQVAIARLQDAQAQKYIEGSDGYKNLQIEIDKRRELLGLLGKKEEIDTFKAGLQSADQLGKSLWDDMTAGGTDSFRRIGQTLKTALLDELYQLTVKKWVIDITASLTGASPGLVNAATGNSSGGLLGMIFGAFGGSGLNAPGGANFGMDLGFDHDHGGGIAGGTPTFTRTLDPAVFDGARRMHTGGIASNEVPTILEEGEGVFTREQMKALGMRNSEPPVVIHNYYTIGDIASKADLQQEVRNSERRTLAAYSRSRRYGGTV